MAVSLEQFVQHLTESGLLSANELSSIQESLPSDRRPSDAETLARALVEAKKLTQYQAQVVSQGETKSLVFDEYVVLDKIGQGGMGVVFKAQHRRMKRVVAVKILPPAAMKTPQAVQRFYREVEAAAKLNHPNVVTAYYNHSPPSDPTGSATGSSRVVRGGYWLAGSSCCRSVYREYRKPTVRNYTYGFRVAVGR